MVAFKKIISIGAATLGLLIFSPIALALAVEPSLQEKVTTLETALANAQVAGDTSWMLISTALVLLMTPALAFFYGGFVSTRNMLNTLMMSFVMMGIVGVTWVLWGYSLAFDPGNPFFGGLQWMFLNGVGVETTDYLKGSAPEEILSYAPTVPHEAFMMFQGMFAVITPALISGAIVERISFKAYVLFVVLWSTFIYSPMAHMVWGKGGFLGLAGGINALDFAVEPLFTLPLGFLRSLPRSSLVVAKTIPITYLLPTTFLLFC